MDFKLTSIGIDIGTTTTKLVVSELRLENRLPGARIPSIEIAEKKILYQSDVHFTPVIDHKIVDAPAIRSIIEKEYAKAGVKPDAIDTGAIIITGETAKKENASRIIHDLSAFAGNFVVAIAGPELESILAGKGSGASDLSRERHEIIANLDIGGGTTNIAVFDDGDVIDNACINIGGRIIEVDPVTCEVKYITEAAQKIIDFFDIPIRAGARVSEYDLEMMTGYMADILMEIIGGGKLSHIAKELMMTSPLEHTYKIDSVMFSGGVAGRIYSDFKDDRYFNKFIYGDIGPVLSGAIRNGKIARTFRLLEPAHTIDATVVGVGAQSVRISGSTAYIDESIMPLKNISIGKIVWNEFPGDQFQIAEKVRGVLDRFSIASEMHPVAVSIPHPDIMSFKNIELLAKGICEGWESSALKRNALVILLDKDFAKVLGQTIYKITGGMKQFLCLDMLPVKDGDYIDIGNAIPGEDAVPVIIKTLVFGSSL